MAIISRINLVEFPSPQPEEPQPMSNKGLPVTVKQFFMDPPSGYSTVSMAVIKLFNPRFAIPSSSNYGSAPEFVHGYVPGSYLETGGSGFSLFFQSRIMNSPTMSIKANNLLLRGVSNSSDLATVRTQTKLGVFDIVNTLNLNEAATTQILAQGSSSNNNFWTNALEGLLENLGVGESGSSQLGGNCILHIWTMCGVMYAITSNGDIFKSTDAFLTNKQTVGVIGENILRLHGGVIFADPVGW